MLSNSPNLIKGGLVLVDPDKKCSLDHVLPPSEPLAFRARVTGANQDRHLLPTVLKVKASHG